MVMDLDHPSVPLAILAVVIDLNNHESKINCKLTTRTNFMLRSVLVDDFDCLLWCKTNGS
jgi:hypothetical protein